MSQIYKRSAYIMYERTYHNSKVLRYVVKNAVNNSIAEFEHFSDAYYYYNHGKLREKT